MASKEPIPDDKKVSKVTGGLQSSRISVYIRNNRARLHVLTFTDFMAELHETFLPMDWAKDTLQKILAACMTLDQSFYNYCTDIITSNNLLAGSPLHLSEECIKEQIFNNITEDLREKLEESPTELATLNTLPFQKWLNTSSKADVKMAKAIRWNMKHVALELEKEEKKKRNLSGLSRGASNLSGSTDNRRPYTQNTYNRPCNNLPALTEEERALLYEHKGCFKCHHLYADHIGRNCPHDFPDTHDTITSALAAVVKAEWEKCHQNKGKPFDWGPAPSTSTPADNGAHIVLIRPDVVEKLGLEQKWLRKPQLINVAMKNEKKEDKAKPVLLSSYVSLLLSTVDNSWTSKPFSLLLPLAWARIFCWDSLFLYTTVLS